MHTHAPYTRLTIPRKISRGTNSMVDSGNTVTEILRNP